MYPLFETICVKDGVVQHLHWHQKRYENALKVFYSNRTNESLLKDIIVPEEAKIGLYKLRVFYNENDKKHEFEKYVSKSIKTLKVVEANDVAYNLKFTDRSRLIDLLGRRGNCDDVLITKNGKITDTSYANIVFTDGEKWFTPSTPLLEGTCRARLLAEKTIKPVDISVADLNLFSGFNLINAMKDINTTEIRKMEAIIC